MYTLGQHPILVALICMFIIARLLGRQILWMLMIKGHAKLLSSLLLGIKVFK